MSATKRRGCMETLGAIYLLLYMKYGKCIDTQGDHRGPILEVWKVYGHRNS